jgi:hypothetical protein
MKDRDIHVKRKGLPQGKTGGLFRRTLLNREVELPEFCTNSGEMNLKKIILYLYIV